MSIAIFGGAGFLGSSVAKAALSKGWRVTSIGRHGRPAAAKGEDWHDRIDWVTGDAFRPETFRESLAGVQHVVHTIGILDYRGFMQEPRIGKVLDKLGGTVYDAVQEVISSSSSSSSRQESPELQRYDRLNREALESVSREAAKLPNIKSFTYVSAADGFPGIPRRYITTKREAEQYLQTLPATTTTFRPIIMRPGFMFSETHGLTKPLARVLGLSYALNSSLNGKLPFIGAAGVKPLAVDRVGSAIVEACADDRVHGIVEIHQIEALADIRWRAEMIV